MSDSESDASESDTTTFETIELFVQCDGLGKARDEKPFDVFAVVMKKFPEDESFSEIGRTETMSCTSCPRFCTSLEVSYDEEYVGSSMLRLDVYERKTVHTERLRDHDHRGTTLMTIADLLKAKSNQLTLLLHHPHDPRDTGTATILVEHTDKESEENKSIVQLDVMTSVLRRRDWNKTVLHQRYELCRAHRYENEDGRTVWLPVYRSDRIGRQQRDSSNVNFWEFSTASLTYRHLCNGDEEREMRLTLYAMTPGIVKSGCKKRETLLAKTIFTVRFVCEIDPTEEVLSLERCDKGGEEDVGNVSIVKAEPTDFGSHFSFKVNFEHTEKYTSGGCDEKKGVGIKVKRLKFVRKKGGSSVAHDVTSLSRLSLMDGLFQSEDGENNEESGTDGDCGENGSYLLDADRSSE